MKLDKLVEASTIKFPRSLPLREAKELLDYLAINLPADINARVEYFENRYGHLGKEENEPVKRRRGTVTISGSIRTKDFAFDGFVTQPARNTSRINAIQFQLIPGYELEEYRPDVRQLWEDVGTQVQNYFEGKEK